MTNQAQIQLAAKLGAVTERAASDLADPGSFVAEIVEAVEASGAILALRLADGVAAFTHGLDDDRARRLLGRDIEPAALRAFGRHGVDRLADLAEQYGDSLLELEEDFMNRLGVKHVLRVATGLGALLLCRFSDADGFGESQLEVVRSLQARLEQALQRLATRFEALGTEEVLQTLEPAAPPNGHVDAFGPLHASCPIPLVLVDPDVRVVHANAAAYRKLDIHGDPPTLPGWLSDSVGSRLDELRDAGGIPDGVSGDYQFVQPHGRRMMRLGLVPLEPEDGDPRWLVSVEHGGPSVDERLAAVASRYALKPAEVEILELLVEGLKNASISRELRIAEATVKYRLGRVMDKTGTTNRADLIATVFSELPTP
jgi:DNA-binding CsgD family transcriptional regulator